MTKPGLDAAMTGSPLEREREARIAVEQALAIESRKLLEANQRLIHEAEAVRNALAETEFARARESVALRERSILSDALSAMSGQASAADAMQSLLVALNKGFVGCDASFIQANGETTKVVSSVEHAHVGLELPVPARLVERPRRFGGFAALAGGQSIPGGMADFGSVIVAPLKLPGDTPSGLAVASKTVGHFSAGDLRLLERVADLASQSLLALREARRNALLLSLIEGRAVQQTDGVLDTPLEVVHRAMSRLTDMQGDVVNILDGLLSARLPEIGLAIEGALARLGSIAEATSVRVFCLSVDGFSIENTQSWTHAKVKTAQRELPPFPAPIIDAWRSQLDAGHEVLVADLRSSVNAAIARAIFPDDESQTALLVPMTENERFRGFLAFATADGDQSYLPGEIHLLKSVAKVIAAMLARRESELRLVAAHLETALQERRLQSVLAAMPDLIVELDKAGKVLRWFSGSIVLPETVGARFKDRLLEDALSSDFAREARKIFAEIDAGLTPERRNFPMALFGEEERWWQLSASTMGDAGYLFVLRDITEASKQTKEIRRLSEITKRTTNLVIVTDVHRHIEWVNPAFEQATGWTLDEVRGRNPGHFLQCDETDPWTVAQIRKALDAEQPIKIEILNKKRNGQHYWLELDIQPLRSRSGELRGYMAVETDVTERREQADALKKAADAAASARATLEAAVGVLQDGFVLYDAEDRLVICNEQYRQIYPKSAPAIVQGATFESILRYGLAQKEYLDAIGFEEEWLQERLKAHREATREIEQKLADGRWLRIFEKATPDGGRVGLRTDITAIKLAEQRAQADRSTAMEASRDGIAITDAAGKFLYMNQAHLEMFGYANEAEVVGLPWSVLYAPTEHAWLQANAMPALEVDGSWSGEVLGRGKDGSVIDQEVSLTRKNDGGLLCITRDISSRRREASERERLRDELNLAQRREVVGQMAAGLAHDFNNLLATIAGSAWLINTAAEPESVVAAGARRIEMATEQAAALVKRLLTLGARPADRRLLDFREPVRSAAELVRSSMTANIGLTLNVPDAAMTVSIDPTDVLQVVLNLAINARDAIGRQHGQITISLAEARSADIAGPFDIGSASTNNVYSCLTVKDDGPGMAAELVAQIFEPYMTTKGSKGTGLGLAIVASVVKANDGAVRVVSSPGKGTEVRVLWPVKSAPEPAPKLPVEGLTGRLDDRAILIVDDQQDVLDVLTQILESAGAEVAPSSEPADIIAAVEADPEAWDLVLTDFDMPGMTGADVAAAIRKLSPRLPVVLITALAGVAGRSGALFDAVIPKPVDRIELIKVAEAAIKLASAKD